MKTTKTFIAAAIIFAALATTIFSSVTNVGYIKSGSTTMLMPDSTGNGGGDTTDGSGGPQIPPVGH